MRTSSPLVAAGSVALASVMVAAACHALVPGMRRRVLHQRTAWRATVRAVGDQLRFARGMVEWRGVAALAHVGALAPQMLAQIRDEAVRAQSSVRDLRSVVP